MDFSPERPGLELPVEILCIPHRLQNLGDWGSTHNCSHHAQHTATCDKQQKKDSPSPHALGLTIGSGCPHFSFPERGLGIGLPQKIVSAK